VTPLARRANPSSDLAPAKDLIVVDTCERDGKRYVVATRNDVRLPRPDTLSPREREALGFALIGVSNKLIAYELGISASTVGVLLHRAAQKLGCHIRAELLERFRELARDPPTVPRTGRVGGEPTLGPSSASNTVRCRT
jgi:DNA-binding CsgD family transcriptional regulator